MSKETWDHMKKLGEEASKTSKSLIIYTHIPLHKPENTCVDSPLIQYDQ